MYNKLNVKVRTNILDIEHKIGNVYRYAYGKLVYYQLVQIDDDGRFILSSLSDGELVAPPTVCATNRHPSDHNENPNGIINISNEELIKYLKNCESMFEFYSHGIDPSMLPICDDRLHNGKLIVRDKEHLMKIIKNSPDDADLNHLELCYIHDMSNIFENSTFNGDISQWDVSNVTNMNSMFKNSLITCDISGWVIDNLGHMVSMFEGSQYSDDIIDMFNGFHESYKVRYKRV